MNVAINAASDQPLWSWQRSPSMRHGLRSEAAVDAVSRGWDAVFDRGWMRWMALRIGGSLGAPWIPSGYGRRARVDEVAKPSTGAPAATPAMAHGLVAGVP